MHNCLLPCPLRFHIQYIMNLLNLCLCQNITKNRCACLLWIHQFLESILQNSFITWASKSDGHWDLFEIFPDINIRKCQLFSYQTCKLSFNYLTPLSLFYLNDHWHLHRVIWYIWLIPSPSTKPSQVNLTVCLYL